MFSFKDKIIRHAEKHESVTHTQGWRRQAKESTYEGAQVLDLTVKDFKTTIKIYSKN